MFIFYLNSLGGLNHISRQVDAPPKIIIINLISIILKSMSFKSRQKPIFYLLILHFFNFISKNSSFLLASRILIFIKLRLGYALTYKISTNSYWYKIKKNLGHDYLRIFVSGQGTLRHLHPRWVIKTTWTPNNFVCPAQGRVLVSYELVIIFFFGF